MSTRSWVRKLFGRPTVSRQPSYRPELIQLEGRIVPAFQPVQNLTVGAAPSAVVVADVNGDGKLDLISANKDGNSVSVLLAGSNGTFGAARTFTAGSQPQALTATDLNRDGKLDLITANAGTNTVSVLLGNGNGTFGGPRDFATGGNPQALAAADLNRDGTPEVVVANQGSNTISILPGKGDGTFAATQSIGVGAQPSGVAIGDVNRDGKLDIVVANQGGNTVSVLLGNGAGSFTAPQTSTTETGPRAVALADLNRDGILDLVTASTAGNSVTALRGKGDGTFDSPNTYATGASPVAVVVADINADGKLDLATANQSGNTVSVLFGRADGTFLSAANVAAGTTPSAIAAADADGDGSLDLVTANRGSNRIGVLISDAAPRATGTTFGAPLLSDAGPRPSRVELGDINLDGKLDAVVTSHFFSTAGILPGNGDGTFAPGGGNFVGIDPGPAAVADVNGDGKPDILVANQVDGTLTVMLAGMVSPEEFLNFDIPVGRYFSLQVADVNRDGKPDAVIDGGLVLLGTGDGTFGASQAFAPGWQPPPPRNTDVNGDGKADRVTTVQQGGLMRVELGNGDGTFGAAHDFPLPDLPGLVARTADVNRDGLLDLFTTIRDPADEWFGFVAVLPGQRNSATRLDLQAPLSTVAGVPITFPLVAQADGGADWLYSGTVRFTSSDPLAVLPANTTFSQADMGSRPFTFTLNSAGTHTITAVDTATGTIRGQVTITVSPVGSSALVVSSFASPTSSGTPGTFTVKAVDPRTAAVMTNYTGTVRFTSSDPQAVLPAEYTFTAADAGVHTFTATLKTAGIQSLTATDKTTNFSAVQSGIQVTAAAAVGFRVTPATSPVTAGTATSFTVTALDAAGNLASGYNGTAQITSSDPQAVTLGNVVLSNGTGTLTATLKTAGSQSMTITDAGNEIDSTQGGIQVVAGRAVSFGMTGLPGSATVGETRSFVLTARDAYGNIATGYTGRVVAVVFPDPEGWVDPTLFDFTAAEAGVKSFTAHFMTPGAQSVSVTDFGNNISVSQSLQVNPPQATLTWSNPASIVHGTPLSATQLNATANAAGDFVYSPAAGTVLNAGRHLLSVTFNPTDTTKYSSASLNVVIDVTKATPTVAWSAPASIVYGTALSDAQLNATADLPGTFTYSHPAGTVLGAGTHTLSVTFTPTDTANYNSATRTVTLTVNKATAQITWADPAAITYGTPLSAAQLNATANTAGTFAYTPAAGAVLDAGSHTLGVTFTPTDTANYTTAAASATLDVARATPTVTVVGGTFTYDRNSHAATASAIGVNGDPVNGTFSFTYNGSAEAPVRAGTYAVEATFASDDLNYDGATGTATLVINPVAPTDIALDNDSVAENMPGETPVGVLSTTDLEIDDAFTYTLVDGDGDSDNDSFALDADGHLKTAVSFDREARSSYSIRVRSTDSSDLWTEQVFIITVSDVDEPLTLTVPASQNAYEDVDHPVTEISAGDPEGGRLTVTLAVSHGKLTLGTTAGLSVTGNGSGSVTMSGGVGDLNAALASLAYRGSRNYAGTDTLSITAGDGSHTVNGSVAISVKSAAQQAADLKARVIDWRDAGVLGASKARELTSKLNLKGTAGDIDKVESFLETVRVFRAHGFLTRAQADLLLGAGNILLVSVKRR